MKKLILSFTLMIAGVAAVNAQDTTSTQTDRSGQYSTQDQNTNTTQGSESADWNMNDKDVISTSELPQPIQEQLRSQDYSGWTVKNAYKKMKGNETVYGVELGNGTEMKKLKFDADGTVIKEKTKRDKDQ